MLQSNRLTIEETWGGLADPFASERASAQVAPLVQLSVTSNLSEIEDEWRHFEVSADCTPFQTYDWLATWHRCIGSQTGVTAAIVTCRLSTGKLLFVLPLAVERKGFVGQLTFLGHESCDYNAPLLAPDLAAHMSPVEFRSLWNATRRILQKTAGCNHSLILLDKMPERVGAQLNPMHALATMLNPSGAHITALGADWESFYAEKRSSTTRRRDRGKRKKLAEYGELRVTVPETEAEIQSTLATLLEQKSRWFARLGVPDLFARPGHSDFFKAIACSGKHFVHVSRLDVGTTCAAASLGLMFRNCYYYILASYDDGPLSRFGPGVAHLHELMNHAIVQGCDHFDFTIGDESYKSDWADTKIYLYDHVSGATLFGRIVAAAVIARLRVKRSIKNSPALWSLATRVRRAMSRDKA
jgi:CelD/BcsL family acetyltransferase involved in cellulose biosynthesis